MKKLVVLGVVVGLGYVGLGYIGYRAQKSDIVFAMKPEEVNLPPKILQTLTNFGVRILPYSGFCEITGCTHEVHSNNPDGFQKAMSDHLATDH